MIRIMKYISIYIEQSISLLKELLEKYNSIDKRYDIYSRIGKCYGGLVFLYFDKI